MTPAVTLRDTGLELHANPDSRFPAETLPWVVLLQPEHGDPAGPYSVLLADPFYRAAMVKHLGAADRLAGRRLLDRLAEAVPPAGEQVP